MTYIILQQTITNFVFRVIQPKWTTLKNASQADLNAGVWNRWKKDMKIRSIQRKEDNQNVSCQLKHPALIQNILKKIKDNIKINNVR